MRFTTATTSISIHLLSLTSALTEVRTWLLASKPYIRWVHSPAVQLGGSTHLPYSLVGPLTCRTAWWVHSPAVQLGRSTHLPYSLVGPLTCRTAWWVHSPAVQLGGSTHLPYSWVGLLACSGAGTVSCRSHGFLAWQICALNKVASYLPYLLTDKT